MINPRTIAQKAAIADISTQAAQLKNQQTELDNESSGLDTLSTALSDFQSAIDGLNSDTDGPLTFSATSSNDADTITADSTAQAGTYSFYVDQLAQAQQTTFTMADNQIAATSGETITLTMGEGDSQTEMTIDLSDTDSDGDGMVDAKGLVNAINSSDENPGVTATLVQTDEGTAVMLTSDTTGAASAFSVHSSDASLDATMNGGSTTSAQDAQIRLNGTSDTSTGMVITSSTNTFDDVIPGVSLTFSEVSTDEPVSFTVAEDTSGTQDKVQTFVDAYNTLVDTLDSLTSMGTDGSASGVFAGDAGIKSLSSQMDNIIHATYYDDNGNPVSIVDYGITLDSDGHLEIDSDQFSAAMEENPEGLTALFVGDDSMVAQLDDLMTSYTDSNSGIIASRQQSIDDQQSKIDDKADQLKETYNTNYDRYVAEYTNTLTQVYIMKVSMAAFA